MNRFCPALFPSYIINSIYGNLCNIVFHIRLQGAKSRFVPAAYIIMNRPHTLSLRSGVENTVTVLPEGG